MKPSARQRSEVRIGMSCHPQLHGLHRQFVDDDAVFFQGLLEGIAAIDLGFPCRYTHSSLEVCDPADLAGLTQLLVAGIARIDEKFSLDRDRYT